MFYTIHFYLSLVAFLWLKHNFHTITTYTKRPGFQFIKPLSDFKSHAHYCESEREIIIFISLDTCTRDIGLCMYMYISSLRISL